MLNTLRLYCRIQVSVSIEESVLQPIDKSIATIMILLATAVESWSIAHCVPTSGLASQLAT